ncbi:MAG: hypothetical protein SFW64_07670 [Alphaproteobacteria bacterium]|nr:hypothetical protein [Alphaproteobacteria bacterium]
MKKFTFVLGILIICALAFWLQRAFPDVKEAISTLLGALIALGGTWLFNQHNTEKAARYLAIRVVCIFDKYLTDCVAVVKDDGLSYGQRTPEGYLDPQVSSPGAPLFPTDVDWKSIDHNLMYEILSFPSDVDAADESIAFTWRVIASPPDFDEYFEERAFHYAQFGLRAHELASRLRKKYNIPAKKYGDWNPITELEQEWDKLKRARAQRENAAAD